MKSRPEKGWHFAAVSATNKPAHKSLSLAITTDPPNNNKSATMDRDSLVYKAKLAEQAERFDEMVSDMKEVARQVSFYNLNS